MRSKILFFSMLSVLPLLIGQACTNSIQFSSQFLPTPLTNSASGNGGTYDGKLVIVHHNVEGFTCEGRKAPKGILLRRSNMNWYYTENSIEKCRIIDQQPVQNVIYDEIARLANYKGDSYLPPQLYKVIATEDPNLPDLNLEDGICADVNGLCSIRAAFDQIVPMNFAESVEVFIPKGVYTLSSQILVTNENQIKITGEDRAATILDGGSKNRIFEIRGATQAGLGSLQISNLTFTHGQTAGTLSWGGAMIINYGPHNVNIDNCDFESNRAEQAGGALSIHGSGAGGIATIKSSTFRGNTLFSADPVYYRGSAIYATGSLVLEDSMVYENGSIGSNATTVEMWYKGPFWLKNSSIVKNLSSGTTYNLGECTVGPCAMDNSTIAENSGVGFGFVGGANMNGDITQVLRIQNSTIAQNNQRQTAGASNIYVLSSAALNMSNTIIASTNSATETNCSFSAASYLGGSNLANDSSCQYSGTPQEPLLGPLADNGGLSRGWTMKPASNSPALKKGAQCLPIDQRHFARTDYANSCDIGAVEGP